MASRNASTASLLEKDLEIQGDIAFENNLYLHGRVNGNIIAPVEGRATLYIQEGSEVHGELRAPLIFIAGNVFGDIFCSRRLTLKTTACVNGNIHYTEMQIDEGAEINGVVACLADSGIISG